MIGRLRYLYPYVTTVVKSWLDSARLKLSFSNRLENENNSARSCFFVFSLGRSGTQFFSLILNEDRKAFVVHEPTRRYTLEYVRSFHPDYDSEKYIQGFRSQFILWNASRHNAKIYGEVNSRLRRHAKAIMNTVPEVKGIFVIRDGRSVVRSMMSRDNWLFDWIKPSRDDRYFNMWSRWGKFEKCCWFWAQENAILYQQFGSAVKFERLLVDYQYFHRHVLVPLQLHISKKNWENERNVKSKNRTVEYTLPPFHNWSSEHQDKFWQICGEMMALHGYS